MLLPRVYAPDLDVTRLRVVLPADEAAHLTRVLRLRAGARVLVFDGRGAQYLGEVAEVTKQAVTVAIAEQVPAASEPRVALTLAQAVLKGDKMDAVVRDATMMGVSAIVPLVTDRTVVPRSAVEQGRAIARWQRVAIASAKQCGRAVVPEIASPRTLAALAGEARPERLLLQLLEPSAAGPAGTAAAGAAAMGAAGASETDATGVAEMTATGSADATPTRAGTNVAATDVATTGAAAERLMALPAEPPASVLLAIGPEGGWSPEEVAQARAAGYRPWTLGARTLRAESAALAALSVLTYAWSL